MNIKNSRNLNKLHVCLKDNFAKYEKKMNRRNK